MLKWLYRTADYFRHKAQVRQGPLDHAMGCRGEDLAQRWLQRHGMVVVARNYSPPGGTSEADLIAWDRDVLAVIEVKTRLTTDYGPPDRNVDKEKHRKVMSAGEHYARRADIPLESIRFDIVSVLILGKAVKIEHSKAAFRHGRARAAAG